MQGGLGAGSANAVAALIGLEHELGLALSAPDRLELAAEIGSDVPLFLIGGAVLGLGRGEEVYPLPDLPSYECVVATPEVSVSTPQAFRNWDQRAASRAESAGSLTTKHNSDILKRLSRSLASAWSVPYSSGVSPQRGDRPRIRFSRLSEPGLKTTSKRSSFLNTPFSETSSAFLRFRIQKHRSSRLFMRRSQVRVQPFSGFTQPRKQRKRRNSVWASWA